MLPDPNFQNNAAEGFSGGIIGHVYGLIKQFTPSPMSTFMRMIVLEVIPDPTQVTDEKAAYYENILGVTNYQYGKLLPRNSIVAQRVNDSRSSVENPLFLYPFFPSHLALPCKPGEMVWAMFEDPNAIENKLGFWFCRVAEPHFIDDVNHTHSPNKVDKRNNRSLKEKKGDIPYTPKYEMHNGPVAVVQGVDTVPANARALTMTAEGYTGEDVFEKLITGTDAAKMMTYEAIPRFRKRPGDIALEGSNNSLIVLGTERSGSVARFGSIEGRKQGPIPLPSGKYKNHIGTIDLVVGRGTTPSTSGEAVSTTRILGSETNPKELKKEIAKYPPEKITPAEGDVDFLNDRSRILLSQRTNVDSNFKLSGYNSNFQISDTPEGDAAITIKTDKVRIIARSDISLLVTNFSSSVSQVNPDYSYKNDNENQEKWASITIKTNGDIVFTPSKEGYIKLGGDGADRAVVCTDLPFTPNPEIPGQVQAAPIFTTGNSQIATSESGQGTYAKKVLVVG